MPTVRKTTPGTVTIHNADTFHQGTTREVPADTADYLVENRSDFERVHDGGTSAFPSEEDATDVEFTESSQDATDTSDTVPIEDAIEQDVCPWCDDYKGEHIGQHASSAHPDEWEEYQDGDSE